MVQWLCREIAKLPALMRWGLFVFAVGGSLDVLYHISPSGPFSTWCDCLGANGLLAHLVTIAGMIVTVLGIFTGRRRGHGRTTPARFAGPPPASRGT